MVRVLLVDDNERFRTLLRRLLDRDPDIAVVAEAGDGSEVVDIAIAVQPHVVVMDVSMPGRDGIETTWELKERLPGVSVLMLSVSAKAQDVADGLARGASEYLVKGAGADEIAAAIKRNAELGTG